MKKLVLTMAAVLIILSALAVFCFAEEPVKVYVTIADENGQLAVASEEVSVTDIDSDGAITISDALYGAHELAFEGGAASGYATFMGQYGLAIEKLWGSANGCSYGYYVNNSSAMGLADPIKEGDYINAFVYTDLVSWSDTYCYFDVNTAVADENGSITLTLSASGYDESFKTVVLPVSGAVITLNGEKTEFVTDDEGRVTITLPEAGEYTVSATSEAQTLVPPVCKAVFVSAVAAPDTSDTENTSTDTGVVDTDPAEEEKGSGNVWLIIGAVVAAVAVIAAVFVREKKNEN